METPAPHPARAWISLVVVAVALAAAAVLTIRYPVEVALPAAGLGGPLLLVLIFGGVFPPMTRPVFATAKLLAIVAFAALPPMTQLGWLPVSWLEPLVMWIFAINLVEAMTVEARGGRWAQVVGGAAMIAVIVTQFDVVWQAPEYLFLPEGTLPWILAYTFWVWFFMMGAYPDHDSMFHAGVLVAPLVVVVATGNVAIWLIARVASLMWSAFIHGSTLRRAFPTVFHSPHYTAIAAWTRTGTVQVGFAVVVLALCAMSVWARLAA